MSDTQWIGADDGRNPNTVPADLINALNREFISKGVKLVIQVGDLADTGSNANEDTRAAFAQALYNAGIAFYPHRGNHDSSKAAGIEFRTIYPQTQNGINNSTPSYVFSVSNPDAALQPFPVRTGNPFQVGFNFSSPPTVLAGDLTGLSYAFDYGNARFLLLDQFTPADSASSNLNPAPNAIDNQQPWITSLLAGRPAGAHAFVFSHKGLITQNHVDNLFGTSPAADPTGTNNFIVSLATSGVRYYMGGHDHMHNRALVTTTDGHMAKVQNLVLASDSSKFYIPYGSAGYTKRTVDPTTKAVASAGILASADPTQTNDYIYNVLVAGGATRETPIAQELNTVGYYIFTVNGPQVTVDFYSAVVNPTLASGEYLISTTPALTFTKRETFGYSLNGEEFAIAQGQSYSDVQDKSPFTGTRAKIVDGYNQSAAKDSTGRPFVKLVDTGWERKTCGISSDVLSLWGMAGTLGSDETDVYTLAMTYDDTGAPNEQLRRGQFGLVTRDDDGNWVNAVDGNFGGSKKFVFGAWRPGYGLGTYGVDPKTHTAWAVISHDLRQSRRLAVCWPLKGA